MTSQVAGASAADVDTSSAGADIEVLAIGADRRAEWDEYVRSASGAELYHDYRWRELITDVFRHETLYLAARAGGRILGVLPLVRLKSRLFGDFMVSMPFVNYGGVVADTPRARSALLDAAVRNGLEAGVGHIELRGRDAALLDWPERDDKVTMLLDLPDSADALWSGFKPKLRAQIRRPQKEGAVACSGGIELLDEFYAVFARNMRDLGTPVYSKRFFAAVLEKFEDESKLHVVRLGGKPVAAGLVLAHRSVLEIPWASSLREVSRTSVNMLLYWSVLEDAANRGFSRFDFGRSTKGSGTHRFKLQWGAKEQQLRWHYWLPAGRSMPRLSPSNPKYRGAIALWRKLPVPVANLLGPHIVRNLP